MAMAKRFRDLPIDYLFVGGSLLSRDLLDSGLQIFKTETSIPLVICPGSVMQVNSKADAMIRQVRKDIDLPLMVGGGIRTPEQAKAKCAAGADLLVVGNILEQQPEILQQMVEAVHYFQA